MPLFQQLKISRSTREDRISPAEGLIESEGPSATRPVCNNALQFDTGGDCSLFNQCDAKFSTVGNRVWRIFGYSNIFRYEYSLVSYSNHFFDANIF